MYFGLAIFAFFAVLLSMLFTTIITAIFHKVAVGALLQIDIVHSGDATVSAHIFGCCHFI
jgi:hypothetical protein